MVQATTAPDIDRDAELHLVDAPRARMSVTASRLMPDLAAATRAAADLLTALGIPHDTESTHETPARMARAYAEMLTPRDFEVTTFPNTEGYDELLVARSLPVESVCEHHMLPFTGVAHVGYVPADRILGLSKFARVVEMFAKQPQTQERLTRQITDWLQDRLAPLGIGVVIEASHSCMSLRGVHAPGSTTVTSAVHGLLREDARTRAEFLAIAHEVKS
jgi:GTP cyclohydrolase I